MVLVIFTHAVLLLPLYMTELVTEAVNSDVNKALHCQLSSFFFFLPLQSLIEFFNKMKKWEDMANLPAEFRERTKKLERNFTVTAVLFKKYEPIFQKIFKNPQEEQPRQHRSRKQR